jgi:hypothetical protein
MSSYVDSYGYTDVTQPASNAAVNRDTAAYSYGFNPAIILHRPGHRSGSDPVQTRKRVV